MTSTGRRLPRRPGGRRRSTVPSLVIADLTGVAGLAGMLVTAANQWGAGDPAPCRDTVTGILMLCAAPRSPMWALVLGAVLPAGAVAALGMARLSRRRS